jgi:hypothetical protein
LNAISFVTIANTYAIEKKAAFRAMFKERLIMLPDYLTPQNIKVNRTYG